MKTSKSLALLLLTSALALPGAVRAAVATGDPAPDFTLTSADGDTVTLSELAGKVVVLEWLNHGCPFVVRHYQGNMQGLQEAAAEQGVVWLSIISSAPGKQGHSTPEKALADAKAKGSKAAEILLDESGEVGRLYDAKTTPHMYVINAEGTLVYQGGIDDRPRGPVDQATNYVMAALTSLAAGESVETGATRPYGCGVKY